MLLAGKSVIWWLVAALFAVIVFFIAQWLIPLIFGLVGFPIPPHIVNMLALVIAFGVVFGGYKRV